MRRYDRYRVPYFQALLAQARKEALHPEAGRDIVRRPGNPMLRYAGGTDAPLDGNAAVSSIPTQENLIL
jgi:hypothetical protein